MSKCFSTDQNCFDCLVPYIDSGSHNANQHWKFRAFPFLSLTVLSLCLCVSSMKNESGSLLTYWADFLLKSKTPDCKAILCIRFSAQWLFEGEKKSIKDWEDFYFAKSLKWQQKRGMKHDGCCRREKCLTYFHIKKQLKNLETKWYPNNQMLKCCHSDRKHFWYFYNSSSHILRLCMQLETSYWHMSEHMCTLCN